MKRKRVDVNLEELDRVLDQAREVPLSEPDHDKLKSALHALAEMLAKPRTTEKTSAVVEQPAAPPPGGEPSSPGSRTPWRQGVHAVRRRLRFHTPPCTPATPARALCRYSDYRWSNSEAGHHSNDFNRLSTSATC
jgi:hypothetical protein